MRLIAALAVISVLLLYVWQRVDLVRVGYDIQQLKTRHRVLQREHHEIRVKVSTLTSPERIARLATGELNMRQPRPGEVVLVSLSPVAPPDRPAPPFEVRLAKHDVPGTVR